MRSTSRLAALLSLSVSFVGAGQTQSEPPLVSMEEAPATPAPVVVEEPAAVVKEDLEAKSNWRIHVSAGAGWIASSGTAPGRADLGGFLSVGKPLYEADRHQHYQWVTDTMVLVGFAPSNRRALLVMTPTFGTNFYLGPVFGLEWRMGAGFGATPSAQTNLGIGVVLEGAITLRLFGDDRRRIKLQAHDVSMLGFLTGTMVSFGTLAGSVAFETPL